MTKKIKTPPLRHTAICSIAAISAFAAFTAGCENAELTDNVNWNAAQVPAQQTPAPTQPQQPSQTPAQTPTTPAQTPAQTPTAPAQTPAIDPTTGLPIASAPASSGDQVDFGSLKWRYGNFNGSGAVHSGVSISGLRISNSVAYFKYDRNLSAWGLSHGDAAAISAVFVQNAAGEWVGGKFDWISSSRTSRELKHCVEGYAGWSLAGVPNPCKAAFVIVSKDGKRRSNVLVDTWQR